MALLTRSRRTPLGHGYADESLPDPFAESRDGKGRHPIARSAAGEEIVLFDLTAYDRFGIKGRGASDWLGSNGMEPPERINTMALIARDLDLVRLGAEDFLILSRPGARSMSLADLKARWEEDAGRPKGFNAWREEVWAWFHVCGDGVPDLLARTCPVDLHAGRFPVSSVAQTRVAQMDCVVVRSDRARVHGFDLFFDVASSEYVLRSFENLWLE
jgi:sarcosine oxidase subunit gamma